MTSIAQALHRRDLDIEEGFLSFLKPFKQNDLAVAKQLGRLYFLQIIM
jgi:hypothetical protein